MALTLVATVGSASANSYSTTAELDTVADELLPAPEAWDRADSDTRARAMVKATRILDQFDFPGDRVDDTQALAWPRDEVWKPSELALYSTTAIPEPVKRAHALLTFYLLEQAELDLDPFAPTEGGIRSMAFGNELEMQFEAGTTTQSYGARFLATVIRPTLGPLVYASQPRTVRG